MIAKSPCGSFAQKGFSSIFYAGDEFFSKKAMISVSLHTVIRGPSFTGFG